MDRAPLLKMAPQPLQSLSPERVNGTRPLSISSHKSSKTMPSESQLYEPPSPFSSPSRKVDLFADYKPHKNGKTETGFSLAQSPTIGDINALRTHARTNSDVQGLVKRFEHLDVRDRDAESAERKKKHEAELRRAQIAREEAEGDVRRLREELRRLNKEIDEGRERERRVGKRLEVVMEEHTIFKDSHQSQSTIYEKEVRKARKEAFKSSSAVVKLQEELKGTRSALRVAQSTIDMEKRKTQQRDQETFDAQYKLVAAQEEIERLHSQLGVIEEERDALKTSLKEEEVARIAAEGMIALPPTGENDDEDLLSSPLKPSPRKMVPSLFAEDENKENNGIVTKKTLQLKAILQDLACEKRKREQAEDMTEFLRLECKFRCCSCRSILSRCHEPQLNVPEDFAEEMTMIRQNAEDVFEMVIEEYGPRVRRPRETSDIEASTYFSAHERRQSTCELPYESKTGEVAELVDEVMEDDMSCTIRPTATAEEQLIGEQRVAASLGRATEEERLPFLEPKSQDDPYKLRPGDSPVPSPVQIAHEPSSPNAPAFRAHISTPPNHHQYSVRTVTTTTTIPMQFTPIRPNSRDLRDQKPPRLPLRAEDLAPGSSEQAISDLPFDREAALAAIAYRRGRAKSMANGQMTPRKQMLEGTGLNERRDISAPVLGQQKKMIEDEELKKSASTKGSSSVGRATGRKGPF